MQLRDEMPHIEAAEVALNQAFPTILTSGSILTIAAFLVGNLTTNAIISALGMALGKGTLISIVIVMGILPQSLMLCDKIIEKTAFGKKDIEADKAAKREMSGVMVVNGRIRGNISGFVDGMFYGVVKGDVSARVDLGKAADRKV